MPDPDLLTLFVRPLEQLGIRYMVSGHAARSPAREPRSLQRHPRPVRPEGRRVYPANRDPLDAWAIARALRIPVATRTVSVAPPEYVILRKLEYYREGGSEKHLRDVRAMLALSPVPIDRAALADWPERLGLEAQWRLVTDTRT